MERDKLPSSKELLIEKLKNLDPSHLTPEVIKLLLISSVKDKSLSGDTSTIIQR